MLVAALFLAAVQNPAPPEPGGVVRQRGQVSTDGGATWTDSFDFTYRPAAAPLTPGCLHRFLGGNDAGAG